MDPLAALAFLGYMLPWIGFALVSLYAGYVAYDTKKTRDELASRPPDLRPDPVDELTQINTELSRAITQARVTLERARDSVHKGVR